jgi:uncharacterized membrane protein
MTAVRVRSMASILMMASVLCTEDYFKNFNIWEIFVKKTSESKDKIKHSFTNKLNSFKKKLE